MVLISPTDQTYNLQVYVSLNLAYNVPCVVFHMLSVQTIFVQAHTSLRDAQQELMRAKAENNSLSTYVTDENEKNKLLKEQLQEQV